MRHLPSDAATVRAEVGPAAAWSVEAHLLAAMFDVLRVANWQRGADPKHPPPKPKPTPRPGVEQPEDGQRIGGKGYTVEEFDRIYADIVSRDLVMEEVSFDGRRDS